MGDMKKLLFPRDGASEQSQQGAGRQSSLEALQPGAWRGEGPVHNEGPEKLQKLPDEPR